MQKKTKKQGTSQRGSTASKSEKLSPEDRALRAEQLVETICRPFGPTLVKSREQGKSLEEILQENGLKGITTEQLGRWIDREEVLRYLFATTYTPEAIAFELEIELSDVLKVVNYLKENVDTRLEKGETPGAIVGAIKKWAYLPPEWIESYTTYQKERADTQAALEFYDNYFDGEEVVEQTGLTEDKIDEIFHTFKGRVSNYTAKGIPIEEQARLLGVYPSQIAVAIDSRKKEIKNLRAITLQTMLVDSKENTRSRVSRLTALRDTIAAEIKSRGLAEISADKLVTLYLKVEESLRAEVKGLEADFSEKSTNSLAFSLSE